MNDRTTGQPWRKSSYSSSSACVEVQVQPHAILIRDSMDPEGPVLRFHRLAFAAFINGVRSAEFDRSRPPSNAD
jgi:hypothetical protein